MNNKLQLEQIIRSICANISRNTKATMLRNTYHARADTPAWTGCPLAKDNGEPEGKYGEYNISFSAGRRDIPPCFIVRVRFNFATDTCQIEVLKPKQESGLQDVICSYVKNTPKGALANIVEIRDDIVAEVVRSRRDLKLAGKRYVAPLSDCEDDS